jgi:hypothetical protein
VRWSVHAPRIARCPAYARQASRLWALDPAVSERVLHSLLQERFLSRGSNDSFVLAG